MFTECLSDLSCKITFACVDGECVNPCIGYENNCLQYGPGYVCQVINHRPQCISIVSYHGKYFFLMFY